MLERNGKKHLLRIAMLTILTLFVFPNGWVRAEKEEDVEQRQFNILFVTDSSGSMRDTDPDDLRYDAIANFLSLMRSEGNNVGLIDFSTNVNTVVPLLEYTGKSDYEIIRAELQEIVPGGYTNIGEALEIAVDILQTEGDPQKESIIVFLTDGQTDMGDSNGSLTQKSRDRRDAAAIAAYDAGFLVYVVCLNADDSAENNEDYGELEYIAELTRKNDDDITYHEVNDTDGLEFVYHSFRKLIYTERTTTLTSNDDRFDKDGNFVKTFMIPPIGITECLIEFRGDVNSYTYAITDGNGHKFSGEELNDNTYPGERFVTLKFPLPSSGEWTIRAKGIPEDSIIINMSNNTAVSSSIEVAPTRCMVGEEISLYAWLNDSNGRVSGKTQYDYYVALFSITSSAGIVTEIEGVPSDIGFTAVWKPTVSGDFAVSAAIEYIDVYERESDAVHISVSELIPTPSPTPAITPQPNQMPVSSPMDTVHFWLLPHDVSRSIDLTQYAHDPDGDKLKFEVIDAGSLDKDKNEYDIQDNELLINNLINPRSGTFLIRATDSDDAMTEFEVHYVSTSLLAVVNVAMGCVFLLAGVMVIIAIFYWKSKVLHGVLSVTLNINNSSHVKVYTNTKKRGKISLVSLRFAKSDLGDLKKAYFQATSKKFVLFRSLGTFKSGGRAAKRAWKSGLPWYFEAKIPTDKSTTISQVRHRGFKSGTAAQSSTLTVQFESKMAVKNKTPHSGRASRSSLKRKMNSRRKR